jgi:hypothetical protein
MKPLLSNESPKGSAIARNLTKDTRTMKTTEYKQQRRKMLIG